MKNLEIGDITPGKPRILRSQPGDPEREKLLKPFVSLIDLMQNWDRVNLSHYHKVCEIRILLGMV